MVSIHEKSDMTDECQTSGAVCRNDVQTFRVCKSKRLQISEEQMIK